MILLVLALCIGVMFSAIACDPDDADEEEDDNAPTELFTNGNFETTSGDTYPLTPSSWTASAGSNSASSDLATPSGSDALVKGVISTNQADFNKNKKTYGGISNPGKIGEDDNILMIYNKVPTSYNYKSQSITLEQDKFYKLSFELRTLGTGSNGEFVATKKPGSEEYYSAPGAYVMLTGDAYAEFRAIDTLGEWKHYDIYLRASALKSSSITLTFSLGTGNASTGQLTQGHLFVDNIVLSDLTDVKEDETAFGEADFDQVQRADNVAKYDITLGDTEFDYASSTTSTPFTPSKYTGIAGYGAGDNTSTSSTNMEKGILDTTRDSNKTLADGKTIDVTVPTGSIGTRMLYIQNKVETAYGYRSATPIVVKANRYYAIQLSVRTELISGYAQLMLTKGANNDELGILIEKIDTKGAWTTYTFYVKANEKRNTSLYLEMWLGWGGTNDTDTHAQGAAFFDSLQVKTMTQTEFDAVQADERNVVFADNLASKDVTRVQNSIFAPVNYDKNAPNEQRTTFSNALDAAAWSDSFGDNPSAPNAVTNALIGIKNIVPSAFRVSNATKDGDDKPVVNGAIEIQPNAHYLISMWVKTVDIEKAAGLTVELLAIDPDKAKYDDAVTTLSTLSNINSENLKSSANENGYSELQFYVQGAELKTTKLALRFSLGSGSATQSASHVKGTAFIGDIAYETVTASDYSAAATGSQTQKASLRSTGSGVSSNGNFTLVDVSATNDLYKEKLDANKNAIAQGYLGVPTNWTISNKSVLTQDNPAQAGVWYLNNDNQSAALDLDATDILNGLNDKTDWTQKDMETYGALLVMKNQATAPSFGYSSNSITLGADSYNMFSVWAKVMDADSTFSLELTTTGGSTEEDEKFYNIQPKDTNWNQYFLFVRTGISGASVKLSLYNGTPNSETNVHSTVLFSNIAHTTVSEEKYENAVKLEENAANRILTLSWLVDSFDQYTEQEEALHTPSKWTGALVDEEASADKEDVIGGIFNNTQSDWGLLDVNPDDAEGALGVKMIDRIFHSDKLNVGNNVLALYNKTESAYQYTSPSATLKADQYYKISVWVMTELAESATATVRLKVNNQTYTFGRLSSASGFNADTDGKRLVNGKEWTEYSYYIKTSKDLGSDTVTATLSIGLGFTDEENWLKGYVFADNYSVRQVEKADFESVATVAVAEDEDKTETWTVKDGSLATNFVINYTKADANSETNTAEPTPDDENKTDELLWLYITSGVLGGLLILAVIVVLVRKYARKHNRVIKSAARKKNPNANNRRDDFRN